MAAAVTRMRTAPVPIKAAAMMTTMMVAVVSWPLGNLPVASGVNKPAVAVGGSSF